MNEENKTKEELLSFRPGGISDPVPVEVFEARLSLLSVSDAELLCADFESDRDPVFPYLWLGGDMYGKSGENASATMTRCAYVGVDEETTMRLYKASGWADGVPEDKLPQMLKESMDFVAEFREEMSKMNRKSYPHVKSRYLTHRYDGGKGGM
ncbi:MAG: hypothetical protein LUD72_06085 [Bacteroidales bacterium]|nr:hypothetical protein [Bacteroidales bacterium]